MCYTMTEDRVREEDPCRTGDRRERENVGKMRGESTYEEGKMVWRKLLYGRKQIKQVEGNGNLKENGNALAKRKKKE